MNTPAFQNKWFVLLFLFTTPLMLSQATCQPKPPTKKTFNPEPIKELALYDRHSAEPYCETHGRDIDRVLVEQYDSIEISSISTTAYGRSVDTSPLLLSKLATAISETICLRR